MLFNFVPDTNKLYGPLSGGPLVLIGHSGRANRRLCLYFDFRRFLPCCEWLAGAHIAPFSSPWILAAMTP